MPVYLRFRVSLTYRVKSAHKIKLTDKQLLQWLFPILLIALIYLSTWSLAQPPHAELITDSWGKHFKQCSYSWWDHSAAIGKNYSYSCWDHRGAQDTDISEVKNSFTNVFQSQKISIGFNTLEVARNVGHKTGIFFQRC